MSPGCCGGNNLPDDSNLVPRSNTNPTSNNNSPNSVRAGKSEIKSEIKPSPNTSTTTTTAERPAHRPVDRPVDHQSQIVEGRKILRSALRFFVADNTDAKKISIPTLPFPYLEYTTNTWRDILHNGLYSTIYKATDPEANFELAIKSLRSEKRGQKHLIQFQEELQVLKTMAHPNIARIIAIASDPGVNCLVLPLAMGGSVQSILWIETSRKRFTPPARLYVSQCLISAIQHLHQKDMLHRDIKPEHLWFTYENWNENPHVVLTDFGVTSTFTNTDVRDISISSSPVSKYFMAPEMMNFCHFDKKSDVFSIGVSLICILTANLSGRFPVENCFTKDLTDAVDVAGGQWAEDILTDFATLVSRCTKKDADHRPTVDVIFEEIVRLRERNGALDRLPEDISQRVTSHSESSMRTEHLVDITSPSMCVLCGFISKRGILCSKGHYTCARDTCLESVARDCMGSERIECPGECCSDSFFLRDLYDKINADVYADLMLAIDRNYDYRHKISAMNGKIITLAADTQAKGLFDELISVHVSSHEMDDLSHNIREERILSVVAEASKLEEEERNLESKRKNVENSLLQTQVDASKVTQMLEKIMRTQEEYKLQHATGLKLLLQGQLQCPQLFIMLPVGLNSQKKPRVTFFQQYRMYFMCSYDYSLVETAITLRQPKSWFRLVGPAMLCTILSLQLLFSAHAMTIPIPDALSSMLNVWDYNDVLGHMELLLYYTNSALVDGARRDLDQCRDQDDFVRLVQERKASVPPEAYGAIAMQACKTENRGWMDKMEVANRGAEFAWVKKENVKAWSSGANAFP